MTFSDLKELFIQEQAVNPITPTSSLPIPQWAIQPKDIKKIDSESNLVFPAYCPKCIFTISHYPFFKGIYNIYIYNINQI